MSNTFTRDPRPRVQFAGDGTRTVFPLPFPVLAADDLLAYVDDEAASGFSITGLGQDGGAEVIFAEPPAAGTTITFLRRSESIRETEFVDGTPFRAAAINAELDRIMLLIQEDREEHGRALRGRPMEAGLDFCLPASAERANKMLGFDSSGAPMAFGVTELPDGGDASGLVVTPSGATTARALGEHLAAVVNVRDFGAVGDGVTDDAAAFEAAVSAAQTRRVPVFVPAGTNPYLLGTGLVLDGVTLLGDGAGSILKVATASGFGLQLSGADARLAGVRVLGPGAETWPQSAAEVDLSGVALDGVQIAGGASNAALYRVEVAGCFTALAIEGEVAAVVNTRFAFNRNGVELRAGAGGAAFFAGTGLHACSSGLRADSAATLGQLAVHGGEASACGRGMDLQGPSTGWVGVEMTGIRFAHNLEADVRAGPRHSLGVRACHLDDGGRRAGTAIDLRADGETTDAPGLIAENDRADTTQVATVELSGGTNLDLLQPGDLVVLATDTDDVDDLWTSLKATRGGVVHAVNAQTTSTAEVELATATVLPLVQAGDEVRIVGRSGTATVDSVGSSAAAATDTWIRTEDHCRVFAAHNRGPAGGISLGGSNAELVRLPGPSGGVELTQAPLNAAFTRLHTFEIAQDTAISFAPDSTIGMVQAFSHGSLGDPAAALFSYRADSDGYTQPLAASTDAEVMQLTALTGTSGNAGKVTYSTYTDGRIYVENRMSGAARTISLFVIGAPL